MKKREFFGAEIDYTFGFQRRNDVIWELELARTRARADVNPIRSDDVFTGSCSFFAAAKTKWNDWFRTEPRTIRASVTYYW